MGKAPGLFDFDDGLKRLSDLGDQLEAFGRAVDFEIFRPALVAALDYSTGERGGRPPFEPRLQHPKTALHWPESRRLRSRPAHQADSDPHTAFSRATVESKTATEIPKLACLQSAQRVDRTVQLDKTWGQRHPVSTQRNAFASVNIKRQSKC